MYSGSTILEMKDNLCAFVYGVRSSRFLILTCKSVHSTRDAFHDISIETVSARIKDLTRLYGYRHDPGSLFFHRQIKSSRAVLIRI